ncbi:polyprenyl diphosphate synthase [Candidatus Parcubacteria bacterium]|nr:di-trans,poly-cis-decaprenylcistransferase [Patescibacteria group bacterium]MBU4309176.1 di-trans,poly-cis-decaprenylcistransferase [Patescibacteria group bacterium]MBU4432699.1 di-trans,poly-cis-decaprenylcistransferase [Patescibacteria group bacterium]MBU4577537.1 di-trans,poly-cis-decaprenylcistransferase [Patescibacteria group bacterium]MCG2697224.1 polyprenyl diphosphate synthase [Candidatus Parcubacteria bacterium]
MTENKNKIPRHIAIMLGGNDEWAKERNLAVENGSIKCYELLKNVPGWFFEKGVKEISFSLYLTNNYKKSENDLAYLMKVTKNFLKENLPEFDQSGYKILLSGETNDLPGDLADVFKEAVSATKDNSKGTMNFCFNYDGRNEIVEAVKKIIDKKFETEQVSESLIRKYLYQNEIAYPDLIVSMAGLQTVSGFLLWQSADSEFISMNKYWPDFEKTDVDLILNKYNKINKKI